jgi:dephospho-CoA kinase
MKKLFFLIGSSGSGKTTAAELFRSMETPGIIMCASDSVGVPSKEEMIKEFGSQSEWQRNNTLKWVKKIKDEYLEKYNVLFDTQSRPSFIQEACKESNVQDYSIILIDCSDEERTRRLIERNSPHLVNFQMMDWARYLRENCIGENCQIIDNTNLSKEETVEKLLGITNFKTAHI